MKGRYCGMCDKWFKTTPTKDCPLCGAETEPCQTDPFYASIQSLMRSPKCPRVSWCGAETDNAPTDSNAVETTPPQQPKR